MKTLKFHQATIYISELHQFLIYFCFRNGFFVHLIFLSVCSTRCQAKTERDFLSSVRYYFLDCSTAYYQITLIYGSYFSVKR